MGAGFGGAAAGFGARFTVVVVCRATVVGGAVDVVTRDRAASGVYLTEASVVGGAGACVVAGAAAWSLEDDSGAEADTVSAAPRA